VSAPSAAIPWARDINDPIGGKQWLGRLHECLPIPWARWREDLHSIWAAVPLGSLAYHPAMCALHQESCAVVSGKVDLLAFARPWTTPLWPEIEPLWLTVVRLGVVMAVCIVVGDVVLVSGALQVHEAIGMVVAIWLVVAPAAEPPWSTIVCAPCLDSASAARIHEAPAISSTTILGARDINNEMRVTDGTSRFNERPPIGTGPWCKDLGAEGATAFVERPTNIVSIVAFHEGTC